MKKSCTPGRRTVVGVNKRRIKFETPRYNEERENGIVTPRYAYKNTIEFKKEVGILCAIDVGFVGRPTLMVHNAAARSLLQWHERRM
jgi:hypothetical protein